MTLRPDEQYPDQGALSAECYIKDDKVIMSFGKSIAWISCDAQGARTMAHTLLIRADQLDGGGKPLKEQINAAYAQMMANNVRAVAESGQFVVMWNGHYDDPSMLMQLGAAMFLDKEIYVVASKARTIPQNLQDVAKKIERADWNDVDDIKAAVTRVLE